MLGCNRLTNNGFNLLISFFIHFDAYTLTMSNVSWNCPLFRCSPWSWNIRPFISVESPVKFVFPATVCLLLLLLLLHLLGILPLLLLLVLISVILDTLSLSFLDNPLVVPDAASYLFFMLVRLISYHYQY